MPVDPRFRVLADFDQPDRGRKMGEWYDAIPPLTRRTRGISLVDYFGRTMVANLPEKYRVGVVKLGVVPVWLSVRFPAPRVMVPLLKWSADAPLSVSGPFTWTVP